MIIDDLAAKKTKDAISITNQPDVDPLMPLDNISLPEEAGVMETRPRGNEESRKRQPKGDPEPQDQSEEEQADRRRTSDEDNDKDEDEQGVVQLGRSSKHYKSASIPDGESSYPLSDALSQTKAPYR